VTQSRISGCIELQKVIVQLVLCAHKTRGATKKIYNSQKLSCGWEEFDDWLFIIDADWAIPRLMFSFFYLALANYVNSRFCVNVSDYSSAFPFSLMTVRPVTLESRKNSFLKALVRIVNIHNVIVLPRHSSLSSKYHFYRNEIRSEIIRVSIALRSLLPIYKNVLEAFFWRRKKKSKTLPLKN
jgi:hypothetical protein